MTEAEQERTLWFGMAKQIAHQMGTPLSAILGWLELLPTAKDPKQVAAEINQNLDRLKYLLERLNQIGPPTRFETISPGEIIREVSTYYESRLPSNNCSIEIHDELSGERFIHGNSWLLSWVLENLVKNSIDAVQDKGGSITLSLSADESRVFIDVIDQGQGIAEENVDFIFQPGFTTRRGAYGTGLPLARYIIETVHGGELLLKATRLGEGTIMRIALKAASKK